MCLPHEFSTKVHPHFGVVTVGADGTRHTAVEVKAKLEVANRLSIAGVICGIIGIVVVVILHFVVLSAAHNSEQ